MDQAEETAEIVFHVGETRLTRLDPAKVSIADLVGSLGEDVEQAEHSANQAHSHQTWAIIFAWKAGHALVELERRHECAMRGDYQAGLFAGEDDAKAFVGESGGGCFKDWVAAQTYVSGTTAWRYMKLARAHPKTPPISSASLTSVYRALGMAPEGAHEKRGKNDGAMSTYLAGVMKITRHFRDPAAIDQLEPAQRKQIRADLLPIVELYNKLG